MEIDAQGLRAWASWVQKGSVECRINQRKQKENAMDDMKTKLATAAGIILRLSFVLNSPHSHHTDSDGHQDDQREGLVQPVTFDAEFGTQLRCHYAFCGCDTLSAAHLWPHH